MHSLIVVCFVISAGLAFPHDNIQARYQSLDDALQDIEDNVQTILSNRDKEIPLVPTNQLTDKEENAPQDTLSDMLRDMLIQDSRGDSVDKRQQAWYNPYGKRQQSWHNPYGKRQQSWHNPYGKRQQSWHNPYGKRQQSWHNPYGKRQQSWHNPYGKRQQSWHNPYGKRQQAWHNPYGKRQQSWNNLYGKRQQAWYNPYGKRHENSDSNIGQFNDPTVGNEDVLAPVKQLEFQLNAYTRYLYPDMEKKSYTVDNSDIHPDYTNLLNMFYEKHLDASSIPRIFAMKKQGAGRY